MPMRHELPSPIVLTEAAMARDVGKPANDGFLAVALFCSIGLLVAIIATSCGVQGAWF